MLQKYFGICTKAMLGNFSWKVNFGHVPLGKEKSVLDMGLGYMLVVRVCMFASFQERHWYPFESFIDSSFCKILISTIFCQWFLKTNTKLCLKKTLLNLILLFRKRNVAFMGKMHF